MLQCSASRMVDGSGCYHVGWFYVSYISSLHRGHCLVWESHSEVRFVEDRIFGRVTGSPLCRAVPSSGCRLYVFTMAAVWYGGHTLVPFLEQILTVAK